MSAVDRASGFWEGTGATLEIVPSSQPEEDGEEEALFPWNAAGGLDMQAEDEEEGGLAGEEGGFLSRRKRLHSQVVVLVPTLSQVKRERALARRRGEFEMDWPLGDEDSDVAEGRWIRARAKGDDDSWEEDEGVSDSDFEERKRYRKRRAGKRKSAARVEALTKKETESNDEGGSGEDVGDGVEVEEQDPGPMRMLVDYES